MRISAKFDPFLEICPLCHSTHIQYYDQDYNGISIYRCGECQNKFMNPQYSDEYCDSLYNDYLSPEEKGVDDSWLDSHIKSHTYHFEKIEKYRKPGKVLAFGCGNGSEVEVAIKRNWQVEAYDVDPKTVEKLRRKYPINIYSGNFFNLGLAAASYDCIYLDQVIEHLKNPREHLQEFFRLLKPNGILFLATPNISSIASNWKSFLGKLGLKKQPGKHYDTWHHVLYFSPNSLSKVLMEYFNFQIKEIKNDIFISPTLSNYRRLFLQIMTKVSFIWRTTFFIIAQKIDHEK